VKGKGFRATLYLINVHDFLINSASVKVEEDMHSWDKCFNGIILDSNFPGNSKKLCIRSLQL